jgi:hypothetical protein
MGLVQTEGIVERLFLTFIKYSPFQVSILTVSFDVVLNRQKSLGQMLFSRCHLQCAKLEPWWRRFHFTRYYHNTLARLQSGQLSFQQDLLKPQLFPAYCKSRRKQDTCVACACLQCDQWRFSRWEQACHAGNITCRSWVNFSQKVLIIWSRFSSS